MFQTFRQKITFVNIGLLVIILIIFLTNVNYQKNKMVKQVNKELEILINFELDHVVGSIYEMLYEQYNIHGENPSNEVLESMKNAIMKTKVGKTGYVYVLGSAGEEKGNYIVSLDRQRDGENIWTARDAKGELFIQNIINGGLSSKDREIKTHKISVA